MKKSLFIFVIISILFLPFFVSAYYESSGPGDLHSNVYPTNLGINQKASITLGSYLINLDSCNITWKQNGEQTTQGTGQKSFSFITGKLGEIVSISAVLNCPEQSQMIKDWLFQTNDVDFLISADTYTPPFYRGNSRITSNSRVKIIALPQVFDSSGELMKQENLIYTWTKNGKAMQTSSGYGKNFISIQANELPGNTNYTVEISTLSGEVKATKTTSVTVENPQLILYKNKPLVGLEYQKGIGATLNLIENETTLTAEPFFFANSDIASGKLIFNWTMNNKAISQSTDGRSVTLRQSPGQTGEATINLQVNNSSNPFSEAKKILKINFGQKTNFLDF